ncbi:MAG: hypothetical protein HC821_02275 [Lewinella sp.]|nr:hypothetical protein [Lewinella sp.]
MVDEPDLDIRLYDAANIELLRFEYIPRDERFYLPSDPFDTVITSRPYYTALNNYRARFTTNPLQPGETYRLRVNHPELGLYEIDQTLPPSLEGGSIILGGRYQLPTLDEDIFTTRQPFTVSFPVPPGQERFYEITTLIYDSDGDIVSTASSPKSADPRVTYFGKGRKKFWPNNGLF